LGDLAVDGFHQTDADLSAVARDDGLQVGPKALGHRLHLGKATGGGEGAELWMQPGREQGRGAGKGKAAGEGMRVLWGGDPEESGQDEGRGLARTDVEPVSS